MHGSFSLQVLAPKRSQSSQDVQHLQQRPSRPTPSLASTPEKPSGPQSEAADGQEGSSRRDQPASNGQPQKAGGLGLLGRVASGLLGSGSRKGSADKKVSLRILCLPTQSTTVARLKSQSLQTSCIQAATSVSKACLGQDKQIFLCIKRNLLSTRVYVCL